LGGNGGAEIALEDAGQVVPVLHPDRLIVAELGHQGLVALGRDAALAGNQQARVAGQDADEGESHDRDTDEGRYDQQQAIENETDHVLSGRPGALAEASAPGLSSAYSAMSTPSKAWVPLGSIT